MWTRRGDDESDPIFPASSRTTGHLLQLGGGQRLPAVRAATIGYSHHDGSRREINAGCHRGRRKNCVE